MKFYVGSKYCERNKAKKLMKELERQGHKNTCDWTNHSIVDAEHLRQYALDDVRGVKKAKVVIFLFEKKHKYKGCFVEMGVALAKNKKVIVIGHAMDSCLFMKHPKVRQVADTGNFLSQSLKMWL